MMHWWCIILDLNLFCFRLCINILKVTSICNCMKYKFLPNYSVEVCKLICLEVFTCLIMHRFVCLPLSSWGRNRFVCLAFSLLKSRLLLCLCVCPILIAVLSKFRKLIILLIVVFSLCFFFSIFTSSPSYPLLLARHLLCLPLRHLHVWALVPFPFQVGHVSFWIVAPTYNLTTNMNNL